MYVCMQLEADTLINAFFRIFMYMYFLFVL